MHAPDRRIGPIGRLTRVAVGLGFIALVVFFEPSWWDAVLGLVVLPALAVGAMALWSRHSAGSIDATGPLGLALNLAFIPLVFIPATAGGAFLFIGASMLLAAVRANGGCEVTAISNTVLHRDDQVGCVLFGPIDAAEASGRRTLAGR